MFLKDIWPTDEEVADVIAQHVDSEMFRKSYAERVRRATSNWQAIKIPQGKIYAWDEKSTYVKNPPYFDGMTMTPSAVADIRGARVLALLGDSVTTDHISPAGNIAKTSPAAKYLVSQGVQPTDFNSYGARRGNHEVMMRGTFANIRLRNLLAPGTEGGVTRAHADRRADVDLRRRHALQGSEGTPLVILAGKEYGTGSSRDWAAKGTMLLGVQRRHRRELRAHPPLEPDRHGRAAAAVHGRAERAVARPHRARRRSTSPASTAARPRPSTVVATPRRTGAADHVRSARAHRYAEGARLLPARRHPALRAAPARRARPRRLSGQRAMIASSAPRLAVFDLDGTITRGDTLLAVPARSAAVNGRRGRCGCR